MVVYRAGGNIIRWGYKEKLCRLRDHNRLRETISCPTFSGLCTVWNENEDVKKRPFGNKSAYNNDEGGRSQVCVTMLPIAYGVCGKEARQCECDWQPFVRSPLLWPTRGAFFLLKTVRNYVIIRREKLEKFLEDTGGYLIFPPQKWRWVSQIGVSHSHHIMTA